MSGLYGGPHQAIRRALAPYVPGSRCWRCGLPILPGQPWDLGHDDDNPALYRGPEHAKCSRAAGARKGNARRRARADRRTIVAECAIALEISEDRQHTSIMAAGMLPLHMRNGLRPEFLEKSGALLFIWTLYVLGVLGAFSVILAVLALRRRQAA